MSSPTEEFHRRGYVTLKDVLPPGTVAMLHRYCLGYAKGGQVNSDALVPGTPAGYGHPCMERVLLQLVPAIEEATGRKVSPTYSYFRVYRRGDVLPRHADRPACEISLSVCLGYADADDWPLWLAGPEGEAAVSLRPGDGVAYQGTKLEHWREPYAGESAAQVFLHYVDAEGPHAEWRFDKRPGLRLGADGNG
ncbi:MAG TPA: hypothetical protein VNW30_08230 [Opitutaceae bacterium]|jgi:hypothetical protein|nr:hypothetical protein [Opitutaceae bacterium]